jgi:cytochrome P450
MDEDGLEDVNPDKEIVKVDGRVAIGAGGDTAATTLSQIWYFLLRNPRVLARLRQEIDEAFPHGEALSIDATKQGLMPYLNACV